MSHNLFIRSTVDGHLACFHFFALRNNAARNVMYKSFGEYVCAFLLVIFIEVELLVISICICLA